MAINPLSALLTAPCLAWLLLPPKRSPLARVLLLLLGGALVFVVLGFFGFACMHNGFAILWYLLMMFSVKMIAPTTAALASLLTGAGLTLALAKPGAEPSGR